MIKKETATKLRQGGEKYTVIPSKTISHVNCADSLALLVYLLDKSENWIVRHADIRNKFDWGQKRCQNSINKLKEYGLLETVDVRNDKGQLLGKEIIVYSSPNITLTENRSDRKSVEPKIGLGDILTNNQSLPNDQYITNNKNINTCEIESVKDLYNEIVTNHKPNWAQVQELGNKRKNLIKNLISFAKKRIKQSDDQNEKPIKYLERLFIAMCENQFHAGKIPSAQHPNGYRWTFDQVAKQDNLIKFIERESA